MARPERYFIGPSTRDKLRDVFGRLDGTPVGGAGGGIPTCLQDMPRPGGDPVRLGKTTSAWNKGTTATITLYEEGTPPSETTKSPPQTLAGCVNKFVDVASDKWVIVSRGANGSYYLIAAECS